MLYLSLQLSIYSHPTHPVPCARCLFPKGHEGGRQDQQQCCDPLGTRDAPSKPDHLQVLHKFRLTKTGVQVQDILIIQTDESHDHASIFVFKWLIMSIILWVEVRLRLRFYRNWNRCHRNREIGNYDHEKKTTKSTNKTSTYAVVFNWTETPSHFPRWSQQALPEAPNGNDQSGYQLGTFNHSICGIIQIPAASEFSFVWIPWFQEISHVDVHSVFFLGAESLMDEGLPIMTYLPKGTWRSPCPGPVTSQALVIIHHILKVLQSPTICRKSYHNHIMP